MADAQPNIVLIKTRRLVVRSFLPGDMPEIHRILDRGESVHALQRVIHYGAIPVARGASLDALSHIGPVAYAHINFRGTYRFPVERYAARLMRAAA